MNGRTRIGAVVAGLVLAAVAVPVAASTAPRTTPDSVRWDSVAVQPSQQEQAGMLRGQALNVIYGLGKPDTMSHAAYRAQLIRGAALNERYGLPVALTSAEIARVYGTGRESVPTPEAPLTVSPADGFNWGDAGIGAAFAAGLALLLAAGGLAARHTGHGHMPHLRH